MQTKRLLPALLTAAFVLAVTTEAYGANSVIKDAQEKAEAAEESLNEVNSQIGGIEAKQQQILGEMAALDQELSNVVLNITLLEDELVNTRSELEEVNVRYADAQATEAREYNDMKKRIRYMYENGNDSLWGALFSAEGLSDFLNRIDYVESVYLYDRDLLDKYRGTVEEVANLKFEVEEEEAELEEIEVELENQKVVLEDTIAVKQQENEDFAAQLASAQALANQYAATIAEQNERIRKEQERIEEEERRKKAEEEARKQAEADAKKKKKQDSTTADSTGTTSSSDSGSSDSRAWAGDDSGSGMSSDADGEDDTPSVPSGGMNPGYTTGISGQDVVNYACQFIGNPYVYGGTSLTEGTDCSGFTQSVFAHFGISLPRTSYEQSTVGQAVSYENAQPGDIIYYTGHVGIYMGGGMIVNASTPATGIKTQSATYRPIVTIRRVL